MRETYEKPEFVIEHFGLTQTVAATCGSFGNSSLGRPGHSSKNSCGWDMGNLTVFLEGSNLCDFQIEEDEPFYGMCYNNPSGGVTIFGS